MYNKIDKNLLQKVRGLSNESIDVIISFDNFEEYKKHVYRDMDNRKFIPLPFINSIVSTMKFTEILTYSQIDGVKYISSSVRVKNLIFESRHIMNTAVLEKFQKSKEGHSVVVIDTGVFPHVDFCLGKNRIIHFVDLINNRNEMYDDNGHGTFVTGVLAGNSIISKYSGIDSNANVIVIKALDKDGEATSVKILQAMQWVLDNQVKYNIKVVCMSFGSIMGDKRDPLVMGAEILWNNNIVVVAAAGNDGPGFSTIMSPGASSRIITVGSIEVSGSDYVVAGFSSRGPAFNNFKPDIVVPGVDIISTAIHDDKGSFYTTMSGTSVSTPMVAGVVSLLLNYNSNYTPDQIKYMILSSAVKMTGDRNTEGLGRLDLNRLTLL